MNKSSRRNSGGTRRVKRNERKFSKHPESAGQPYLTSLTGIRSCSQSLIRCIPGTLALFMHTAGRFGGSTYLLRVETVLSSSHSSQSVVLVIPICRGGWTRSVILPTPKYYITSYREAVRKMCCGIFAPTTTSGVPGRENNLPGISLHG